MQLEAEDAQANNLRRWPSASLVMRIRSARWAAVISPNFRGMLYICAREQIVVTTVPFLRNPGAAFAQHYFDLTFVGSVDQNAFLGCRVEACVVEAHVGAVILGVWAVSAEKAHRQRGSRSLLNAHLAPLSRHAGRIRSFVEAHLS